MCGTQASKHLHWRGEEERRRLGQEGENSGCVGWAGGRASPVDIEHAPFPTQKHCDLAWQEARDK